MIRNGEKPTQLHNNCSGKHAAMLAFARFTNTDLQTYEDFEHPLQRAILETVSQFTDVPIDEIKLGVDGCAAPNFAVPIRAMAKAFVWLVNPPETFDEATKRACKKLVEAMVNCPEMIGGTKRLDTMLMQAGGGKFISKIGAEGVYSAAVLPSPQYETGLGVAFKIEDGDDKRARAVVIIELFRQLGIFDAETLKEFSPLAITNRRGDKVGETVASFDLQSAAKSLEL
jgi:L-asparaginase II